MFSVLDHIDTLIAADFYEENNQPFLSEAMKLLNRPCLELSRAFDNIRRSGSRSETGWFSKSWSRSGNLTVNYSRQCGKSRSFTRGSSGGYFYSHRSNYKHEIIK